MKLEPLPIILLLLLFPFFTTDKVIEYNNEPILEAYHIPILVENKSLADTIIEVNKEFDIELYLIASKIISCESGWDYTAKNPNSTAYGISQIIDGTWKLAEKLSNKKLDRYNKDDQLYATIILLNRYGTKPWESSKYCWINK